MTFRDTMFALESAGSEQTRATYLRHGAGENTFGVKFADYKKLKSKIKTDHQLARQLWATGNSDARMLATMIADPAAITPSELDLWMDDVERSRYYALASALVMNLAAKSPHAHALITRWIDSKLEFTAQSGWELLATRTTDSALPDSFFEPLIHRIERQINTAPNRARHAMNNALIAIGVNRDALRPNVLTAAARIGKVQVDHGDTACKTPDATAYIAKTLQHRAKA